MKIIIKETGEEKGLVIIDGNSGCEWTRDLLGNNNALDYDEDLEEYVMSEADFEWWSEYIENDKKTENEVGSLAEEIEDTGYDENDHNGDTAAQYIWRKINESLAGVNDLDDERGYAVEAMNDIRREFGLKVEEN